MPLAYLTKSWRIVRLDFGPGLDDPACPLTPPVLIVREGGGAGALQAVRYSPAWLVTPELLASVCWLMDRANENGPPGSPEVTRRIQRWLAVLDALGDEYERIKGECYDCYERYRLTGGPPPLPTPPKLTILRRSSGVEIHSPWDMIDASGAATQSVRLAQSAGAIAATPGAVLIVDHADCGDGCDAEEEGSDERHGAVRINAEELRGKPTSDKVDLVESQYKMISTSEAQVKPKPKSKSKRRCDNNPLLF